MSTRVLEIPYPEELPQSLGETTEEFEQEIRFLVSAKLYEMGRISSGRAAERAGLTRVEFLEMLNRYRISVFNYSLNGLDKEIRESRFRSPKVPLQRDSVIVVRD